MDHLKLYLGPYLALCKELKLERLTGHDDRADEISVDLERRTSKGLPYICARYPAPGVAAVDVIYPNGRHTRYLVRRMEYPSIWKAAYRAGMSTGRVLATLRRAAGASKIGVEILSEGYTAAEIHESDLRIDPGDASGFAETLETMNA